MAEERQTKPVRPMGGRGRMMGPRPKLKNPGKIFGRVMGTVMRHYPVHVIIVLCCIVAGVLVQLRGTMFLMTLIDGYITPIAAAVKAGNPADYSGLVQAIIKMAIIFGIGILANFVQAKLMIYVGQGTLRNIRIEIFEKMESLPIKYFDTHSHGDIMSIYTNDVDALRQMISQALPNMLQSIITIVGVVVSMIRLSLPLSGVSLGMVVVMFIITGRVLMSSGKYFVQQQASLGKVNGHIEEMMEGQKVVKVFCHEDECVEKFDVLNEELFGCADKANRLAGMMGPLNGQLGNLSYVLCVMIGAALAVKGVGGLTTGALASFLQLNRNFTMPISQISQQFNSVIMALAGADRIFKLIDEKAEEDEGYVTLVNAKREGDQLVETTERTNLWAWKHFHKAEGTTTYVELKGEVVFDGVDFGYVEDKMVLHDVKLQAQSGEKLAFVGSTGAGKTTITNLINRFYDIQDGKIRYDGINVNKIKKADLRRSLGVVLQDVHLFTGTIKDNIRYGRLDATDEEVIAAAKLANADSFIRKLPNGYDTEIKGDGGSLSQGQRQLLSIARAAIADPPALILDEATSSIDTRTEKLVQSGMDRLMKGRTTFVIAHRLSTIQNADCIMVLEQGRIIERGNHEQLISQEGKYYSLYTGKSATA